MLLSALVCIRRFHDIIASLIGLLAQVVWHALVISGTSLDERLQSTKARYVWELGIVPGNRLDQRAQVWSRHSEDKRPVLIRVQIAVREDEQALVGLRCELVAHDYVKQVLCAKLLTLRIKTHSCFNQLVNF